MWPITCITAHLRWAHVTWPTFDSCVGGNSWVDSSQQPLVSGFKGLERLRGMVVAIVVATRKAGGYGEITELRSTAIILGTPGSDPL